ncbi:MAG: S9 family peptidase [Deltaproteobacteria bacterium]|nr:S9 family peptidase [Deltaproteobacteria bacterium]
MAHADTKPAPTPTSDDPYLWLEETDGAKAMDWVKAKNAVTVKDIGSSAQFKKTRDSLLEILDSTDKIPYPERMGDFLYNFWKDKDHPRGIWRRTTLDEYRKDKPNWELLIDVDALGKAEKENWVYEGAGCLKPEYRHCLVYLSRGGADATVVREFDLSTKQFVKDGFTLPEAKTTAGWIDANTLYVATDFGPGSMTASGYPRIVKEWKRGTPLSAAKLVYEGKHEDLAISASHDATPGFERDFVSRGIEFFSSETFVRGKDGRLTLIDVPKDAEPDPTREWLLVQLRTAWTVSGKTYAGGSLLATKFDDFMAGKRDFTVLFEPTPTTSLSGYSWTRNKLILMTLQDVVSHVEVLTPQAGVWKREPLGSAPPLSSIGAVASDPDRNDEYFLMVTGFLTPSTISRGVLGKEDAKPLKHEPSFFDGSGMEVKQFFAASKDGTRVPYFVVAQKNLKFDGQNPTLLYGYGGFEVSEMPFYDAEDGRAWISRGGVYVLANIRGGGEYGPRWHQAALKQNRLRAYEDFAAVAQDLMAKKITSHAHLGMMGGSNGGLLMGNMLTLYPELASAIVCQVPLLDMKRYTHLSAGASWIAEYGDPDKPEEWKWIQTFSPYQAVKKGAKYPAVLFTTSTRDDRVGPAHARKMAAKLIDLGYDARFYENIEGGHGAAADNAQAAFMSALGYEFLWSKLK